MEVRQVRQSEGSPRILVLPEITPCETEPYKSGSIWVMAGKAMMGFTIQHPTAVTCQDCLDFYNNNCCCYLVSKLLLFWNGEEGEIRMCGTYVQWGSHLVAGHWCGTTLLPEPQAQPRPSGLSKSCEQVMPGLHWDQEGRWVAFGASL